MREIKFRGKYKQGEMPVLGQYLLKKGTWVYGDLRIRSVTPCIYDDEGRTYPIDIDTIGQFTGLHDKNGKEIYEGDIIDIYDSDYETHDNNEVSFKDGVFGVENWTGNLTTLSFFIKHNGDSEYSIEVVGNVYDNPELLKGNA